MSKATKNFIAGALVATLPLFVASLMKDDAQVVQTAAGAVAMDHHQAKAEELGLIYSPNLLPPAIAIESALKNAEVERRNIRLSTATAVVGSTLEVAETFSVDLVWNRKPVLGAFIYSGECLFVNGDFVDSQLMVRHISTPNWDVADPEVNRSSVNKVVQKTYVNRFCDRLQESGAFDDLRQVAAGAASSPEKDI